MPDPVQNHATGGGRVLTVEELREERDHWRGRYEATYQLWLRATVDQALVGRAVEMAASLAKVRALHPYNLLGGAYDAKRSICLTCGKPWPCLTIQALGEEPVSGEEQR